AGPADQLLSEEGEHHHDEDGEGGAFEETTHGSAGLVGQDGFRINPGGKRCRGSLRFLRVQNPLLMPVSTGTSPYGGEVSSDQPTLPHRAGCGTSRRGPIRTRSRSDSGSRSRRSGWADRPYGAPVW